MHTLTLMEQVLTLGIEADLFTVERGGERIDTLRTAEIDEVLIFGQISVSPAAIHLMLSKSMAVVFLSARGQYRGRLLGHSGKNIELRLRQFDRMRDDQFALGWARAVAAGKIANQRGLLLRNQREHQRDDLAGAIASMRRLLTSVAEAENRETLRGLEGQAAALYFGALGKCLRNPAFAFARRSRRPPLDPPNAILSFGYVLLGSAMESLILRVGLEPLLGAFHSPEYGRPSLALDLIEEFRAPV
ncbi:MAG: CRISPR-associated endonuclease Cas1, partial [Vicinamibacteria bacterium]|nr:CRISPR-associated endonuclease Cas1 [Vicinamibacteria bacterium]